MLSNKKILVVDDSQMNRLIAVTILKKYWAIVLEAVNGLEAVKTLADMDVDLVLIDIEMPVMDGMEAVRIIRERLNKSLPVIALTANSMNGDNDKYIEAGMNAYLCKPFKENELMDMVAGLLNKNRAEISENEPARINPATQLFNLSALQIISRGDKGFIEKMLKMFMAQTPALVWEMEEKYQQKDYKAMGLIAHKIKPSIDNMGIASLKECIREIEKIGREHRDDETIPHLLQKIKTTISLVTDALQKEFFQ